MLLAMMMTATEVKTSEWQGKTVSIAVWPAALELHF